MHFILVSNKAYSKTELFCQNKINHIPRKVYFNTDTATFQRYIHDVYSALVAVVPLYFILTLL